VRVNVSGLVAGFEAEAAEYLSARPESTLSFGLSVHGERTLRYLRAEGAQHAPVPDATSLYEIGSVSKLFMATVLATLEARGTLALDDPISKHLPPHLRLAPEIAAITVRDLATHSSGLPDDGAELLRIQESEGRGDLPPWGYYTQYLRYRTEHLLSDVETATLQYPTGEGHSYSVLGMGVLGLVMELAAGRGYEELLHEIVTGPLGLRDTGYASLTPEQERRVVWAYGPDGQPDPSWHWDVMLPQGGLRSTIADLLTFAEANVTASREGDATELGSALRRGREVHWSPPEGYLLPGTEIPFPFVQGLAWMGFRTTQPGRHNWWHPGTTQFYNCGLGVSSEHGVALTAVSSAHSGIGDPAQHIPMVMGWFLKAVDAAAGT
jgi:CubicO group peptidase (beta-lactamase class C family)